MCLCNIIIYYYSEDFKNITQTVASESVPRPNRGANGFIYGAGGVNMPSTTKERNDGKKYTLPYECKINNEDVVVSGIYTHPDKQDNGQVAVQCPACTGDFKFLTKESHIQKMFALNPSHAQEVFTSTSANRDFLDSRLWSGKCKPKGNKKKGNWCFSATEMQSIGNSVYAHYMSKHPGVEVPKVASRANESHHNREMEMNEEK